ncbi:HD-GYP domain-containing protein [Paenibacillus sp. GXUN7292]|uniref:HD-GYP domain-containing protein n=1 Tax=Paenibacillus sp. GXUN7292 TaxID=3422499 RepID=UPI003D7C5362
MLDYALLEHLRKHHETTYYHSLRVAVLCYQVGVISNIEQSVILFRGGLFHDIGKLLIPSSVLSLRRALTLEEYALVKQHVQHGVNILKKCDELEPVIAAVEGHHEREDGGGYPFGGTSHSDLSRIVAVCDVYDSMTEEREYRRPISKWEALRLMEQGELGALSSKYIEALSKVVTNNKKIPSPLQNQNLKLTL